MPKWMTATFGLLLSLSVFSTQGQSVDEVIRNYVDAIGGSEKLNSIKSVYMEGVAVMQNGHEVHSKIYRVDNKLFRRDISFGMEDLVFIITDKEGWSSRPGKKDSFEALPAEVVQKQQSELNCAGPLVDYAAKGNKAELLGNEDVNGQECFRVRLTLKTGQQIDYFIDPVTWCIVRETRKGSLMSGRTGGNADAQLNMDYSDYKKTDDGYLFPHTVKMGAMGASLTYEKIEVNKPIDSSLYKPE